MNYHKRNSIAKLPYRPGVGMMIINKENKIFVGQRLDARLQAWQMPQGGIDLGETPSRAAIREMVEEIGCDKGKVIAESKVWYSYDIPKPLVAKLWDGQYRGQRQKWFLIRFTGEDSEINLKTQNPEFSEWCWVDIEELEKIIVPFKIRLYREVIKEFKSLIQR